MTSSAASSSDPLLSSLCPYCNAQPPKYRCPACSARTCSLTCSKKHKVYSQCSGVRDPTAFVKRSQLVQPSKLAQDYNYLLSVEKAISRGPALKTDDPEIVREGEEQDSGDEGRVILGAGQLGNVERERLAKHIEETRGVVVKQAPRGMKRARENDTVFTGGRRKKKTVRWTVEWLVYDQGNDSPSITAEPKRMLSTRVQENRPLSEAFVAELHHNATSTSISSSPILPAASSLPSVPQPPSPPSSSKSSRRTFTSSCQFYLKATNVPANEPTLIELSPQESLFTSLRGHVVLEFPTIVVVSKEAEGVLAGWSIVERPKGGKELVVEGGDKTMEETADGVRGGEECGGEKKSDERDGDVEAPGVGIPKEEMEVNRMDSDMTTTNTAAPAEQQPSSIAETSPHITIGLEDTQHNSIVSQKEPETQA